MRIMFCIILGKVLNKIFKKSIECSPPPKQKNMFSFFNSINFFIFQKLLFYRVSVAEPGYKVTIQQDFLVFDSERQLIPRSRHKSIEMYKPRVWEDVTRYEEEEVGGGVVCLKVEVAPADREAREDFNKFIREMIEQKSNNGEILS